MMEESSEFKSQLNYSDRKMWIPETIKHPAKAHLGMLENIILEYTKEGDTILDPMAGIGSTGIMAMLHNRNCVMVEYEDKFCRIAKANIELNQKPRLLPLGHAEIIQGDARYLTKIISGCEGIIFSPPYAEQKRHDIRAHNPKAIDKMATKFEEGSKSSFHTEGRLQTIGVHYSGYSEDDNNIGNLKYGDIDAIVTSPPYAETGIGDWSTPRKEFQAEVIKSFRERGYFVWRGKKYTEREWRDMNYGRIDGRATKGVHKQGTEGYSTDKSNIGNLPFKEIDSIITSPPYQIQETSKGSLNADEGKKYQDTRKGRDGTAWEFSGQETLSYGNKQDNNQIGNLKNQTYLEAMKMVYQGCYDVLKPEGIMVLITKNFIRNKQIIPLDKHTIQLCESIGFRLIKRHYREIAHPSFWRILYRKKYGIEIKFEDILVFQCEKKTLK